MKIICIGRNYVDHISELNNERPDEPVIFIKPDTSLLKSPDPFIIPDFSNDIHHEVEIVIKITKVGKHIQEKFAHKYYDEIGLGIDFTARDVQAKLKEKGLPWEKAKSFDNAAFVSHFVSKHTFSDLNNLQFSLAKNNVLVQEGTTNMMLWKMDELIAYCSKFFTLKTGDLIFTGTPKGVSRVEEKDILEGYLGTEKMFTLHIR